MIKSIADIDKIRQQKLADLRIRMDQNAEPTKEGVRMPIKVCGATLCTTYGSIKII